MLQFVIGSSGAGKSQTIYKQIIDESLKNPGKQYFVLIPEQASLEAQKKLVALHPGKGIMNIDTLSFMRLAYRIFAETGVKKGIVLDDSGKTLIVRRVLDEKQRELSYFAGNSKRRGFCEEMKSVLSELFQYGIDEERLEKMLDAAEEKPVLLRKLRDVDVVYRGFKEFLQDRFIVPEEIYELFARAAEKSKLLRGSVIVLDGYTGFTPSQYCLLEALMRYADRVYVTVTMDAREALRPHGEHELFYLSWKTMDRLKKLAGNVGCEVADPLIIGMEGQNRFSDNPGMAELESKLFRPAAGIFSAPCPVEIRVAGNPIAEVKAIVCEIKKELRKGQRYKDMAIITGALEQYAPIFARELRKAGIPAFLDFKRGILSNPVTELLRAVLELPETGFSYDGIFRVCKCILFETDTDACDEIENYVIAMGIRGKSAWKQEWTRTWVKPHPPELVSINETRNNIIERLLPLTDVLENASATVSERVAAVRDFISREQIAEKLQALCCEIEKQSVDYPDTAADNALLIREYNQIMQFTDDILSRTEELLGNEVLSPRDFRELIELGFCEAKVGVLPPGMDCLVVGDVERTRLSGIKKLFFAGVNEGIIPAAGSQGGILSDTDRSFFADLGIELSPTMREKAYTGELYLYMNMTKPSEGLYVSYSEKSADEKPLLPSYLIAKLKNYYPNLKVLPAGRGEAPEYILGSDRGFTELTNRLRNLRAEGEIREDDVLLALAKAVPFSAGEREELLSQVFYRSPSKKLQADTAREIYGDTLYGSISRLETFAKCNLRHFIKYGLNIDERKEYEIRIPDLGTLFHNAMEKCSLILQNENRKFTELTDVECHELAGTVSELAAQEFGNGIFFSSKRNEYIIRRVEKIIERTLKTTRNQLQGSKFEPSFFEKDFEYSTGNMKLTGRIDRIDTYEDKNNCYVKIVDYKSGDTTLKISDVANGLSLQLGVYLGAAMKLLAEKYPEYKAVPAAVFYYHLKNPFVGACDDPEAAIAKELRPDGLVNDDPQIIRMLDDSFIPDDTDDTNAVRPNVDSVKIPVKTGKEGYSRTSKLAGADKFSAVVDYLDEVMKQYSEDIMNGEASANPVKNGNSSTCSYCEYADICAFSTINGKCERTVKKLETEEAWELIGQKNRKP